MILKMYSIKDELNGYTTPIPFTEEATAKRYFYDQFCGNPTINNSPKDFSLWYMGTFDSESGTFISGSENNNQPKLVERAESYGKSN